MASENVELALAAIVEMSEESVLGKKPNVDVVESAAGIDISAAERDEAWEMYQASLERSEPDGGYVTGFAAAEITNNHTSTIIINDVEIPSKEARSVPAFNSEHAVISAWLDASVISVS